MNVAIVLASGEGWLALDKPAEASSHNATEGALDAIALAERALENAELRARVGPEAGFHPSPVHRLDVGTSGVLILACSRAKARELQEAFEKGPTEKVYLGICRAQPNPSEGEWAWPLSDRAEGRRDPQGKPPHKPARTHYKTLESTPYFSLLELRLESGRTHQIRRHAALAKHVLAGDGRYGNESACERLRTLYGFDRLALHHHRLTLRLRAETVSLESPLPDSFRRMLDHSRAGRS